MKNKERVVVLGASTNPDRYAYRAVMALHQHDHLPIPVGVKSGEIADYSIQTGNPMIEDVDTLTLYLGPQRQVPLYDYILALKPKRIIFNPGTENQELKTLAEKQGIATIEACTLVMLSIGNF